MDKRLGLFSCRYFHLTAERLKFLVMVLKNGVHSLSFAHTISNLVLIVYKVSLKLYFLSNFPTTCRILQNFWKYFDNLEINFTCLLSCWCSCSINSESLLKYQNSRAEWKKRIHCLCAFHWQLNAIVEASWVWIDASTCLCFGVSLMLC